VLQDKLSMAVHQNNRKNFQPYPHLFYVISVILFTAMLMFAQVPADAQTQAPQTTPPVPAQAPTIGEPGKTSEGEDKYVFGVLPNYRTAEMSAVGHPLTAKQKLTITTKDSFAPTLMGIAVIYAFVYQAKNTHPEFGQGIEGYAKRLGTSYSDQVIGNFMTEGIFPVLLKQDPRYFRMSQGSVRKRMWYSVSRIFVTRTDSGNNTINLSELMGNAAAAGIGLSYYPDSRNPGDYLSNWAIQLGTDAFSQVLKEFWPDVKRWSYNKRRRNPAMSGVPPGQAH
jgi:hypothetical protein